jgi:alcohol dehydrogenase
MRSNSLNELKEKARKLLREFKGYDYVFGVGCLHRLGKLAAPFGKKILLITNRGKQSKAYLVHILDSLRDADLDVIGPIPSSRPNALREDVVRLAKGIAKTKPDSVVVVGGGSGIDAAKAASVLACLGGDLEDYFGVGKVSEKLRSAGKTLIPVIALQTASSSAAHLTKYSNISDIQTAQKKLIVDEAIVPPKSLFDYQVTRTMPPDFTMDGAFDGLAHSLEVFFGAQPETFDRISKIAEISIELLICGLEDAVKDGNNLEAREILGLGTDLGGYAIMVGGTSGAHLTSFSLVDILSHGRACAIMNPYYTVFFGPAIQPQLQILGQIYAKYGFIEKPLSGLGQVELAKAVAKGMMNLAQRVGFPTKLEEIHGFSQAHIQRALNAAKNPQLEMKLRNMPIPLNRDMIDEFMGPVLEAAASGDFSLIKNV